MIHKLEAAWIRRQSHLKVSEALRIFHGPTEDRDGVLESLVLEKFQDHYWIYEFERAHHHSLPIEQIVSFLKSKQAKSIVFLERPIKGELPKLPVVYLGEPPLSLVVREAFAKYEVQFLETRHPGIFLDHYPLRVWLKEQLSKFVSSEKWSVLNTFAYTGSLSVASAYGGASEVTTLDLSKKTIEWAKRNWSLNSLECVSDFIYGDVFEWLPRLAKKGRRFDCVILDPPSFSHSDKKNFSTQKDLVELHELALGCIKDKGVLITSINTQKKSIKEYEAEVLEALDRKQFHSELIHKIQADTAQFFGSDHLKGFVLKVWK